MLLDEERYARLEQRAAEGGRSVAAIIREAIDEKLADPGSLAQRRAAAEGLLAAAPPSDGADWSEVKDDLRGRGA